MAKGIRHTAILLLALAVLSLVIACGEDTRTPAEKTRQELWENLYWDAIETVGDSHDLYLDTVMRDDEEKKSRESGLSKDAKSDFGDDFELGNIVFTEFAWDLLNYDFNYVASKYNIDPRGTLPICLHYVDALRNITLLLEAATPLEAGPYAVILINVLTKMSYVIHLIEESNGEYLVNMGIWDRDKVVCDNLFDMAKRSVDPDLPEYDPVDPREKPEELPIHILEWAQGK